MNTMKYYFKKTFNGMVLMIQYRTPDIGRGEWLHKWRKATEAEAQKFIGAIHEIK